MSASRGGRPRRPQRCWRSKRSSWPDAEVCGLAAARVGPNADGAAGVKQETPFDGTSRFIEQVVMATKVVIAGGGVAALEAALALRVLAEERVRIELDWAGAALLVPADVGCRAVRAGRGEPLRACCARLRRRRNLHARHARGRRRRPPRGEDLGRHDLLRLPARRRRCRPDRGCAGRADLPRPGRHGADPHPARGNRRRRRAPSRLRRSLGRGLVAAALRAGADDRGTSRRASDPGRRANARHPRG